MLLFECFDYFLNFADESGNGQDESATTLHKECGELNKRGTTLTNFRSSTYLKRDYWNPNETEVSNFSNFKKNLYDENASACENAFSFLIQ
ncbi:hypothetical protein K0M31_013984 [Melipona bicolor]|uniref:Uncharacterized protein n=1 Tax=Melipona bicolor TaxID=60889 RepID=A0AA40KTX7_9HYME|nr:hypothetical protein K0M31_013984 [Melipona bicolor]